MTLSASWPLGLPAPSVTRFGDIFPLFQLLEFQYFKLKNIYWRFALAKIGRLDKVISSPRLPRFGPFFEQFGDFLLETSGRTAYSTDCRRQIISNFLLIFAIG